MWIFILFVVIASMCHFTESLLSSHTTLTSHPFFSFNSRNDKEVCLLPLLCSLLHQSYAQNLAKNHLQKMQMSIGILIHTYAAGFRTEPKYIYEYKLHWNECLIGCWRFFFLSYANTVLSLLEKTHGVSQNYESQFQIPLQ